VEDKLHFVLECPAYQDIRLSSTKDNNFQRLFRNAADVVQTDEEGKLLSFFSTVSQDALMRRIFNLGEDLLLAKFILRCLEHRAECHALLIGG